MLPCAKRSHVPHVQYNNMNTAPLSTTKVAKTENIRNALGLVLFVLSAQIHAMDFTPDASRVLSDPAYMPERGQTYGVTNYSYAKRTGDDYNNNDTRFRSFTVRSSVLNQSFDYGVIDNLSVRVNATYERNSTQYDFPDGTSATADAYGFRDPGFGVTLRVLEQDDDSFNWDLVGGYVPTVIEAQRPTSTRDGTVSRGGPLGTFGTAASYKTRSITVYVNAEASYLGASKINVSNSGGVATETYEPSWQYFVGLNTQTRITDMFAINVGVSETINNNSRGTASFNGFPFASFDSRPGNLTRINVGMALHILPQGLAAVLSLDHYIYGDSSTGNTQPPNFAPTFAGSTKNESANSISLRLLYVWD